MTPSRSLEFSPDGKSLVTTDTTGFVLWSVQSGEEKFRWRSGLSDPNLSPGWSPDGKLIALPSMELEGRYGLTNGIAIVARDSGKIVVFRQAAIGYARTARFSPDRRLVATAGHDCRTRVTDARTLGSVFEDFTQTTMFACAFSPDGRQLVAGSSWSGVLLLYNEKWESGTPVITKQGTSAPTGEEIHRVDFVPDGKHAFTTSDTGVRLWERDWKKSQLIPGCSGRVSADGKLFALTRESRKNVLEIWKLEDFATAK